MCGCLREGLAGVVVVIVMLNMLIVSSSYVLLLLYCVNIFYCRLHFDDMCKIIVLDMTGVIIRLFYAELILYLIVICTNITIISFTIIATVKIIIVMIV